MCFKTYSLGKAHSLVNAQRPKMVRNSLKILHQMLNDFKSVSDHFGRLFVKGLKLTK